MTNYTHIVLTKVSSSDRRPLERIENEVFADVEAVKNKLCFNEDNPMALEDVMVIPITEFMDMWNNQDDDTPKDERIKIEDYWFGYVNIGNCSWVGKKLRIVNNLECFVGYEGQELTITQVLENDYVIVEDHINQWEVGIEETDFFQK